MHLKQDRVGLNLSVEGVLRKTGALSAYDARRSHIAHTLGSSASRLVYSALWPSDQNLKRWAHWKVKKRAMRQKNNSEYQAENVIFWRCFLI